MIACMGAFTAVSVIFMYLKVGKEALPILFFSVCMSGGILFLCYRYFQEQHGIMEDAISQITEYIAGSRDITIECNDEGELYRLFHEVNSLVSILNAHAEKEKSAKKFLKQTISDISHQLKTPLAALNIYNGILQEETENFVVGQESAANRNGKFASVNRGDLTTMQEFIRLSEQELDRIETLVQNLLKITKLDAGMIVLEKSMENVADFAERVRDSFAYRTSQEGKEIILAGDESVTLLCDKNWIIEAVSNLVKNALDHTGEGGVIRIEWKAFDTFVQITVKDNGSGIDPEDLYHIFKRFYRSRYSKDTQGIGLGLPLTKAIVETHGGTIEVDSTPGEGTSFILNFMR